MAGFLALLALTPLVSGCRVNVPETHVPVAQRKACSALVGALPDAVSDQRRRETKGDPYSAAWGDPAIVLRCGVGKPADYDPTVGCQTVNGVDWYIPPKATDDQQADVEMTTYGRVPAIEVHLPAEYRPPVAALVDLAEVVTKQTTVVKSCS